MKANRKIIFRRKLVAVAVASCFTVTPAFANPIGATVVNGQVGFATQGSTLTVTNSPNAIINWQQFSINTGETTRFIQQSAQSAVLNRVVGQDPSQLLGSLLSNGRVYLINPNGILFGQGAVIDVGGLVASTLKLTDGDFLAGRLNFTDGVGAGGINNQGSITTPTGGNVYLIAPDITNSGVITSPQGEILLAAGHSVNLMDTTTPNVQVTVGAPDTQAVNIGALIARSGKVGIYGALIDQQGLVNADTAVAGANGKITLKANQRVDAGGTISAQGAGGGTINVMADMQSGTVNVTGTLDASAPNSGNGGFIETSAAHVQVADTAHVTTLAAHGNIGTWLIDPNNFTISASGDMTGAAVSSTLGSTNLVIQTTTMGTPGGNGDIFVYDNITKTANTGGTTTLTLQAENSIIVEPTVSISSTVGALNVVFNADSDGLNGGNIQMMSGSSIVTNGGNITLGGGTPLLGLPSGAAVGIGTLTSADASGIYLDGATLNAGGGNISMVGTGAAGTTFGADGIYATDTTIGSIQPTVIRTAGAGTITMNGTGGAGPTYNSGVRLGLNTQVSTVDGAISITGQGGNGSDHNIGVYVHDNATITATGAGDIILNGTGGAGTYRDYGVRLSSSAQITTNTGDISITGQGAGGGASNYAIIHTDTSGPITSTAGNIILTGMGAGDAGTISLSGAINAVSGDINISGVNLNIIAGSNSPITITAGHDFIATLTGTMLLQGGNAGNNQDASVKVHGGTVTVNAASLTVSGGTAKSSATADATLSAGGNMTLALGAGGLTVQGGTVNVSASYSDSYTATANATVSAGGDLTIDTAGAILVQGGTVSASASAPSLYGASATANADALLSAGGLLTITNATGLTVQGGNNAFARATDSGTNFAKATANATVQAGSMDITLSGPLLVQGGSHASAGTNSFQPGDNTAIVEANALLHASGDIVKLTVTSGDVTIAGGNYASASGTEGHGIQDIRASANAELSAGGDITLTVSNGNLAVQGGSNASASVAASSANAQLSAAANANAKLAAGNNLTLDVGSVMVAGGNYVSADANGNAGNLNNATAHADALLSAGNLLTITHATGLTVQGGNGGGWGMAGAFGGGSNSATATANATVQAGSMDITLAGPLTVQGGSYASADARWGSANAQNTATANADALLSATGALIIRDATGLTVQGGYGASANAMYGGGNHTANATANATVQANTLDITVSGGVDITGASNANAYAGSIESGGNNTATASGNATVAAATGLTLRADYLSVWGSSWGNADAYGYGVNKATSNANAELTAGQAMTLNIIAGGLTMRGGEDNHVNAAGGGSNSATLNYNATISAGTDLTLTVAGGVIANNGSDNYVYAYGWNGNNTAALNVNTAIHAGNLLTVSADSLALGGSSNVKAYAYNPGNHTASIHADVSLISDGAIDITVNNGISLGGSSDVSAYAYDAGVGGKNLAVSTNLHEIRAGTDLMLRANSLDMVTPDVGDVRVGGVGQNLGYADASSKITAGRVATIEVTGPITVSGGYNPSIGVYMNGSGSNHGSMLQDSIIKAGTDLIITAGSLTLSGASGAYADNTYYSSAAGNTLLASATAQLVADGNLSLKVSGNLDVVGGQATANGIGNNNLAADAGAKIISTGNLNIDAAGNVLLQGGSASATLGATASAVAFIGGYPQTVTITTGNDFTILGTAPAGSGGTEYSYAGIVGLQAMTLNVGNDFTLTGGPGTAYTDATWGAIGPGTGKWDTPFSPIILNVGGVITIDDTCLTCAPAFVQLLMSALPPAVLGAVDFGANSLNDSINFTAFIEPIHFGEEHEDEKNEKPVCR